MMIVFVFLLSGIQFPAQDLDSFSPIFTPERVSTATYKPRADFHLFKRRGRKIFGGVQATPLRKLRQGLGIWIKAFHTK